jgi:sulfotransferase
MLNKVHFISGLPRSGSTLLSAVLRQNPKFQSDITGPLATMCMAVHQKISGNSEFSVLFDEKRCAQVLRGMFEAYYAQVPSGSVIFDTNRSWTGRAALLGTLYPECRIICCVREIGWILDSIERMRVKNPLILSKLFGQPSHTIDSIYSRVEALMNSESGLIGASWSTLREAWFSEAARRLILIPYEALVKEPARTLRRLYEELNEPFFEHDFQNVVYDAPDYDANLGMPGLHTVQKVVEHRERRPVIPPDVFSKYDKTHFWAKADLNVRNVTIL